MELISVLKTWISGRIAILRELRKMWLKVGFSSMLMSISRISNNQDQIEGPLVQPKSFSGTRCRILTGANYFEGLATGHLSRHRTNLDFDDAFVDNGSLADLRVRPGLRRILAASRPPVELILDIQALQDPGWTFWTQPGAFRRIVMNLFGNALKYTKHGWINVSLRVMCDRTETLPNGEKSYLVKLVVHDTGQGMSPEYLRTKIFTPFAQENARSAGTGLGLSIVKALVNNVLGGEIDIKSILNTGTIVTVTLPMRRRPGDVKNSGNSSREHHYDPHVAALQRMPRAPQVSHLYTQVILIKPNGNNTY
jgi:signal transduction histidine kinase